MKTLTEKKIVDQTSGTLPLPGSSKAQSDGEWKKKE